MGARKFIGDSLRGPDDKPSSKKITALIYTLLSVIVVLSLLFIAYRAVFKSVDIKASQIQLLELLAGSVLWALLITVAAMYGVSMAGQIATIMSKKAPGKKETTIIQEGDHPEVNVEKTEIK